MTFKNVLIIGAGVMGRLIANIISDKNINVFLFDKSLEMLKIADKECCSQNITLCSSLTDEATNCDLVIESIIEDLKIKQQLFAEIDKTMNENTIFTSNSSSLIPSKINKHIKRKNLFCSLHFHSTFEHAKIIDIMPTKHTDEKVVKKLKLFVEEIEHIPIVTQKESSGYVFNAMLMSVFESAITLVLKDIATIEDVDKSWMGNFNMDKGPFMMMDEIGLDTVMKITKIKSQTQPLAHFGVHFLKKYVDKGKLGVKSGEGFYVYNVTGK